MRLRGRLYELDFNMEKQIGPVKWKQTVFGQSFPLDRFALINTLFCQNAYVEAFIVWFLSMSLDACSIVRIIMSETMIDNTGVKSTPSLGIS